MKKLDKITFSEIMEFYPEHNRSVYEELKNACRRGCIIPFVGAGLSAFCGYQGWPEVLDRLAKYIFDPSIRAGIETMIKDGELLQAAQGIQKHYPRMLKELQKIIDYDKIRSCSNEKLYASAAYVLPYLFKSGFVMTTNFDRVLEEVYDRCRTKFGKVITPYEPDLLTQSRQGNPHCLFKLHGDIGPEIHDIERLVFTQAQYDRAYAYDGPLMRELPQWFQNKTLLFLGSSLAKDKTMEVLQQVTKNNPGLDHYAILSCGLDEISRRCVEMGDLGISAIYYPKKRHEAVRVILERLLEETNHTAYEELSRYARKSIPSSKADRRFMYDSDYIPFVGRERELAQLQDFCQAPEQISWWAIAGPGGIGKSRLIYEFTNTQRNNGWKICWLKHSDYDDLIHWTPPVDRCIVVADDVQAHLQTVGNWINSVLTCQRSEKLRIILLERDGKDLSSARWAEQLQSDSPYDDTISSGCYCSDFLNLTPLSDDELKAIMEDFAKASSKPLADSGHAERLLHTLKKIDGDLRRPIYALAITDAWCGGKDPTHWNKEQVLDALVTRELKFYYDRLRSLSTDKISKETRSELENLLARSCMLPPFLPLDQIADDDCPKLRKRAGKLDMTFPELLRQIGIIHKIEIHTQIEDKKSGNRFTRKGAIEAVILDCPDLVKEYLVLRQALDKGKLNLLLPENWDNEPFPLLFLMRTLRDYPEKLGENNSFWTSFFAGDPKSELPACIYSDLLFGTTVWLPKLQKQALNRLEKLHCHFHNSDNIAVAYAKGLFNLSVDQALEDCALNIDKLRLLYEQFPTNEDLAVAYAKGLVNLSAEQTLVDRTLSVGKLRLLYEQFPTSEELATAYAEGLVNLSAKQILKDRALSFDKLELLYEQFLTNEKLTVTYAIGLVNLSVDQASEDRALSVEKLRLLYEQFPTNEDLAVTYAEGLVNLSLAQTREVDIQASLNASKNLLTKYQQNIKIQLSYAQTQFNLTLKQETEALQQSIARLREFLLEHPDANQEFQVALDKYLNEHPEHTDRYRSLKI